MQVGCQKSEVKGQRSAQPLATCHLSPATFSIFNIATGKATSLLELLDTLEAITGNRVDRSFSPSRLGDIQHSLADISKVRNVLGYEPAIRLKDGLDQLIKPEK
jgi:UDP-N-acetylglucosamine 4-epimerase